MNYNKIIHDVQYMVTLQSATVGAETCRNTEYDYILMNSRVGS